MQSYKVIEPIGEGSFGSVYLAQDEGGQRYALKKIHIDPFEIDQALQEIELMKKFQHPNLVRIYNYHLDEDAEELQIVMEYCEQGDLMRHFTNKKKLSPKETLEILRQIFHAFILMTVKGVIHRDLKPENILLGAGGVVKIGDFGCAKSVGEMDMSKVDNFSLDKGTFLYVSPEQLRNEKYSFKCDVWAAGCIAYLLTFGYHPFLDSKPHNTLLNIQKRTEGRFIELDATADPTLLKLISLCLIYEDKERASWREVWLSRVFSPKVTDIRKFVDYLKNVTSIASWMTKEFWKIRKEFAISKNSDEIFVYFLIKFQYTNLKMALKVLKKSANCRYLFDEQAFAAYEPSEEQFHEVKKAYLEHEKYFLSIKKTMQTKDSFAEIAAREPERASCFSDLEKSIRAAYKILSDVKEAPKKDNKVWMALAYWLNFEAWFSFEKDPHHEKLLSDFPGNVNAVIAEEVEKYEQGYVE